MKPARKLLYPDTPDGSVKPEARKSYVTWVNAEDEKPRKRLFAMGRFLRDFKVWATEWRAQ
jgi:hypothetical protein